MDNTVLIAYIALGGVILSAIVSGLVSVLVSKRTLGIEINKLHFQIKQLFSGELLKKRLEIYPKLYNCLSSFAKKIESQNLSREILQATNDEFAKLDSEHAIYFLPNTITHCLKFRKRLRDLIHLSDQELREVISSPAQITSLTDCIGKLELALKSELGVYGFESITPEGDIRLRFVNYYNEIDQAKTLADEIEEEKRLSIIV